MRDTCDKTFQHRGLCFGKGLVTENGIYGLAQKNGMYGLVYLRNSIGLISCVDAPHPSWELLGYQDSVPTTTALFHDIPLTRPEILDLTEF